MSNNPLLAEYTNKLVALRASASNRIKEVDQIIARHFAVSLDELTNKYRQSLSANSELTMSLSVVRETLLRAADDMTLVALWLRLKVPKIEDGGNFGLHVQHEIIKHLESSIKELHEAVDKLPDYFSARSAAVEKIVARTSADEKVTKTHTTATGDKDGNEDKESVTKTEEKSTKSADPLFDHVEAVISHDVKWWIILKRYAELARNTYLAGFDLIEKNFELLDKPRGSKSEGSHLTMF